MTTLSEETTQTFRFGNNELRLVFPEGHNACVPKRLEMFDWESHRTVFVPYPSEGAGLDTLIIQLGKALEGI